MISLRIPFQTEMRAASVELLAAYATAVGVPLQMSAGRPTSIHLPTAFIDRLTEDITYTGLHERVCRAEAVLVHGLFDSTNAADQKDTFVDGFIDYVMDHVHQAGPNTEIAVVATEDDPNYTPDWIRINGRPPVYYATRITLEGKTSGG